MTDEKIIIPDIPGVPKDVLLRLQWTVYEKEDEEGYIDTVEEYDYADNFRAAKITDPEQMARYKKALDMGCCGYYDHLIEGEDGEYYLIGFNYGH